MLEKLVRENIELRTMLNKAMKKLVESNISKYVYVIGISDAEANSIISIHLTYKGALKVWDKERLGLIEQEEHMKNLNKKYNKIIENSHPKGESHGLYCNDSEDRAIFNFSCEDPTQINNYPNETPYITKYELEE
mgnify:CR=1 FL=1